MRALALSVAAIVGAFGIGFSATTAHAVPKKETKPSSQTITIEPGDSLSAIATTKDTSVQRLFDANTDIENPDLIYPGEILRIPHKDEQLASRPMPVATVEAPAAPVAPVPTASARTTAVNTTSVASGNVWDRLAQCESGGNWATNTGNGYYGGLQFSLGSWQAVGGSGLPSDASREEQIMRGEQLRAMQGWGAWPACSSKLGLR